MGCDIHLYKEKHVEGKWITADKWTAFDYGDDEKGVEVRWQDRFTDRNYMLFGLLAAGVRERHEYSFQPRGWPYDACAELAAECERYGEDGHSHSYLYLFELKAMLQHLQTVTIHVEGMKDRNQLAALRASIEAGNADWDLLFPYAQWSNQESWERFEFDVPASFYLGASLERIIHSFDGIEGDNHRIVFFFDN